VTHACAAEASYALAEMERLNIEALATLTTRDNAQLRTFPPDLIAAARSTAGDVLGDLAGKGDKARKVYDSYTAFRDKVSAWSRISTQAVLEARLG
jgi:TRAP-type mannitol/chloroaromatic compound transport system substrate-binding protein